MMNSYKITYGPKKYMTHTYKAKDRNQALDKFYMYVDNLESETGEDLEWMTECIVVIELKPNGA